MHMSDDKKFHSALLIWAIGLAGLSISVSITLGLATLNSKLDVIIQVLTHIAKQ